MVTAGMVTKGMPVGVRQDSSQGCGAPVSRRRCVRRRCCTGKTAPDSFIRANPTFAVHNAWYLLHERQGCQAKGMALFFGQHTQQAASANTSSDQPQPSRPKNSDQPHPSPYKLHGAYYLKDRESKVPGVYRTFSARRLIRVAKFV